ncbi:MAG TPA: hypothetical protein VJU87_07890 [Gemmatimonadaceae bacterium]|nr:hypothetical protein [Gemmatimonadaceae bacterium]
MAARNDTIEALEGHWAVATFAAAERDELLAAAEERVRALQPGARPLQHPTPAPEDLLALAGAFDLAARERLDLEGAGSPLSAPEAGAAAARREYLRAGANRAFVLLAAAPLEPSDEVGMLYRVLLLAALAQVAGRGDVFRAWLAEAAAAGLLAEESELRWDLLLLRRLALLWAELLAGAGPSGLERAMELVASIREERPARERELLASFDEPEEMRMRFYLFALHHVTDAATQLLLFRLHGAPADVRERVYLALSLARSATSGDMQILPAMEWLYEGAASVIQQRTPQLELLPEGERTSPQH